MDYKNGKIYKLVSHQTDKIYIGSTCTQLRKRLWTHRAHYNHWKNGKHHYTTSFEIIQYGDAEIVLIANAPCNSKEELHAIERSYIEGLECVNKYIPGRNKKEYYHENKAYREAANKKNKAYYQKNKEKLNLANRAYYEKNKEKIIARRNQKIECQCGAITTKQNLNRHKISKKHWSEPIGLANFN